jgi:hypothetical protein
MRSRIEQCIGDGGIGELQELGEVRPRAMDEGESRDSPGALSRPELLGSCSAGAQV